MDGQTRHTCGRWRPDLEGSRGPGGRLPGAPGLEPPSCCEAPTSSLARTPLNSSFRHPIRKSPTAMPTVPWRHGGGQLPWQFKVVQFQHQATDVPSDDVPALQSWGQTVAETECCMEIHVDRKQGAMSGSHLGSTGKHPLFVSDYG